MHHGMEVIDKRRTAPMGDHGTVLNVVSWLLLVIAMCTLIARFCMKLSIKDKNRRFGSDDLFIAFAALFSIGQTVAISFSSIHALGQHSADLNAEQLKIFQKAEYAGCMLYIANMGCARISVCLLIKKILPGSIASTSVMVFAGFTVLWTISGVFVTAFPCSVPNPWQFDFGKKCINLVKWINYVGITNIVVEILLVAIPLVVWNLRTSAGRRLSVSLLFLARLSVVAAVAAQLSFFNRYALKTDYTYTYWRTALCYQIAQNLSIITANLPCLHPFIIKVLAGTIQAETIAFDWAILDFLNRRGGKGGFDAMSSQSSTLPMTEEEYCRPLATYGLDRSSAHLNSQHFNRFPVNVATPLKTPEPPENLFMSPVPIPPSRPTTVYSTPSRGNSLSRSLSRTLSRSHSKKSAKSRPTSTYSSPSRPPQVPKNIEEVGCLPPAPDWETDSSDRGSERSGASSRRPVNSIYVFKRSKVISVPEESHIDDSDGYCKKYYPPLPSPKMPRRPQGS
ncbi:hypothetical protein K458DRAFT_393619 [Lentithecium fluviatile CBS 122367]|uniref:Rhodopsin domain-containing protein n=1 Tax=Lentithecium fluviatile CBS 122367 TaxID=1168545 RepID=A0A6G1IPH8_9PLEO|nr:hypothetical protein K458DRAFT_393619 [Lentithecium fluviatile CBS 122367]